MRYIPETKIIGKYRIDIIQDEVPEDPREWGNATKMVFCHRGYNLGDEHDYKSDNYGNWGELKEAIIANEDVHTICPVYMMDHSGLSFSTNRYGGMYGYFDSGQIGYMLVTNKEAKDNGWDEERCFEAIELDLETYGQYISGDVYGYTITEIDEDGDDIEEVESCWGYYGTDSTMEEAEDIVECLIKKDKENEIKLQADTYSAMGG